VRVSERGTKIERRLMSGDREKKNAEVDPSDTFVWRGRVHISCPVEIDKIKKIEREVSDGKAVDGHSTHSSPHRGTVIHTRHPPRPRAPALPNDAHVHVHVSSNTAVVRKPWMRSITGQQWPECAG
jgi:hypothetical protein